MNQKIDLHAVLRGNLEVEYRPEKFPGLVFRLKRPKTAILIFSTGKLVCVGTTREEDVYNAVENFVTILDDVEVLTRKER